MTTKELNGKTHRMVTSMAGTEPRIEVVKITPELARRWLHVNCPTNRKVSGRTVEAYAREMKAGRWTLTHQAIAFNMAGELIDGQHRLEAVALSETTIRAYVSTGLPLEYNAPIDQGYGRKVDQILQKSSRWVSVVRNMYPLEVGDLGAGASSKLQLGMIEEIHTRHPQIDQVIGKSLRGDRMPAHFLSAAAFAFPLDPQRVLSFVEQVCTGEMLERGEPAYTLRRFFLRTDKYWTGKEKLIAACAGIRSMLRKQSLEKITVGRGGEEKEGYAGYLWLCGRRRVMKLTGTPTADQASFKAMAEEA